MMPKKPLVGITPQYEIERERSWIRQSYVNAVVAAGGLPVMLDQYTDQTVMHDLCARLDGILFSGGVDLHPKLYGEAVTPECGAIAEVRDVFEEKLYAEVDQSQIPVLGICRGIQSLNVFSGGSLYQHIPGHSDVRHPVRIVPGTRLYDILGKTEIDANSHHHQAVKAVGKGFLIAANAEDDIKTIEAIERPGARFFIGVQWHPEALPGEEDHEKLFRAFVAACAEYGKQK